MGWPGKPENRVILTIRLGVGWPRRVDKIAN